MYNGKEPRALLLFVSLIQSFLVCETFTLSDIPPHPGFKLNDYFSESRGFKFQTIKHFDALKINDKEKIILSLKSRKANIRNYVNNNELFSVIPETHFRMYHVKIICMPKVLQ